MHGHRKWSQNLTEKKKFMVRGQMGDTDISYNYGTDIQKGYDRLRVSRGWQGEEIHTKSLW
jgi:hypothetical protein